MPNRWRRILLLALGGLLLAGTAGRLDLLRGAEAFYGDCWHQLAGPRWPVERVLIVTVDDATLDAHPLVPLAFWSPLFARAVSVLRALGAGAIGLDLLFSITAEDWLDSSGLAGGEPGQAYDRAFKEELARGDVVLAGYLAFDRQGGQTVRLPVQDFYLALPSPRLALIGLTNFLSDPDGAVRRHLPRLTAQGQAAMGALLAVRTLGQDPLAPTWNFGDRRLPAQSLPLPIEFAGPPGTVPRLSLERLLAPGAATDPELARLVAGKVALVAVESGASQDLHQTPYSRSLPGIPGRLMSGPEVHANIAQALLAGRFSRPVPGWLGLGLLAGLLGLAAWGVSRTGPARGLLLTAVLAGIWSGAAYACFLHLWRLPVAEAQAGLGFCYLGTLASRLTGEERRRRTLQRMFGRYVSPAVVDRLLQGGKMPDLGGEVYEITVLFSDIRNFTSLSERLHPSQVVAMLNAYFSQVSRAVLAQGGAVDKYIGDAVMALFGAPVRQADHARRAVRTALAIQDIARDFRSRIREHTGLDDVDFAVGVGLHTGPAVVGNIGGLERLDYTAVGDTVNLASRLEGLTKELGWAIVASEATVNAAGPGLGRGASAVRKVKGRVEAVAVNEITGIEEPEGSS